MSAAPQTSAAARSLTPSELAERRQDVPGGAPLVSGAGGRRGGPQHPDRAAGRDRQAVETSTPGALWPGPSAPRTSATSSASPA